MTNIASQMEASVESQVADIVDEITERLNRGEMLDVEEYTERYPSIAATLRRVIETLSLLHERAASHSDAGSRVDSVKRVKKSCNLTSMFVNWAWIGHAKM